MLIIKISRHLRLSYILSANIREFSADPIEPISSNNFFSVFNPFLYACFFQEFRTLLKRKLANCCSAITACLCCRPFPRGPSLDPIVVASYDSRYRFTAQLFSRRILIRMFTVKVKAYLHRQRSPLKFDRKVPH